MGKKFRLGSARTAGTKDPAVRKMARHIAGPDKNQVGLPATLIPNLLRIVLTQLSAGPFNGRGTVLVSDVPATI
ncbi:hypothetical protein [Hoeflea ulvae]|uniref:Uncharacterized protein n=1 Tax=Hoeflea ulvae TaxID=2983764 RepID=A0ABT3YGE7_9HYPH|nr:hypothetical protein [Hoeflea ulvae]MCY0094941.1 hypothetical protein [Hoeflea ulvae]